MRTFAAIVFIALAGVAPEFAKYPGEPRLSGDPVAPSMATAKARKFRTVLRQAAAAGPNFNGHYRVTHWGQGTGIIEWAVINLANGKVWFAPEPNSLCPYTDGPEDPAPPDWYEVHEESALLYLYGCDTTKPIGHTMNARFVYVWEGTAPRLLRVEGR